MGPGRQPGASISLVFHGSEAWSEAGSGAMGTTTVLGRKYNCTLLCSITVRICRPSSSSSPRPKTGKRCAKYRHSERDGRPRYRRQVSGGQDQCNSLHRIVSLPPPPVQIGLPARWPACVDHDGSSCLLSGQRTWTHACCVAAIRWTAGGQGPAAPAARQPSYSLPHVPRPTPTTTLPVPVPSPHQVKPVRITVPCVGVQTALSERRPAARPTAKQP